ncbi:helix-turn-helix domain-containing protein [Micromonospora sp. NPDC047467]|uniref:helix-turn-helix domain-containing protein n=1 Tax=Micromonospora sp. NPDC047467 TaxID=3154814 RepID=UPI0033FFC5E8
MTETGDWTTVGEQVRQARLGAGLSQAELGAQLGLDRTMIAKIESGVRRVDALELIRLAAALDVPIDHLLEPRPTVISRRSELLAENDTDVARRSQRLEIALASWLRDVRQLLDAGALTLVNPVRYDGNLASEDDARAAARWLRSIHGVGTEPIATLMDFCERSGQYVLVSDVPGEGASMVDGDVAVSVVSIEGDPGRRRATAAHELGHLVLGDEYSGDLAVHLSRSGRESLINAFAAELLLPVAAFGDVSRSTASRDEMIRLTAHYRTSWSLALRQAEQAGWLDASSTRWSRTTPTRAEIMDAVGWAPQPDLDAIRVPPGYSHAVMEAWRRDFITDARAVELLHGQISLGDLPARDETDLAP